MDEVTSPCPQFFLLHPCLMSYKNHCRGNPPPRITAISTILWAAVTTTVTLKTGLLLSLLRRRWKRVIKSSPGILAALSSHPCQLYCSSCMWFQKDLEHRECGKSTEEGGETPFLQPWGSYPSWVKLLGEMAVWGITCK